MSSSLLIMEVHVSCYSNMSERGLAWLKGDVFEFYLLQNYPVNALKVVISILNNYHDNSNDNSIF